MVYNYLSLKCFPIFLKYYFQVFFDGQNNSKYRDVSRLKAAIITQLIPDIKFTSSFSTIQSYQLFFLGEDNLFSGHSMNSWLLRVVIIFQN